MLHTDQCTAHYRPTEWPASRGEADRKILNQSADLPTSKCHAQHGGSHPPLSPSSMCDSYSKRKKARERRAELRALAKAQESLPRELPLDQPLCPEVLGEFIGTAPGPAADLGEVAALVAPASVEAGARHFRNRAGRQALLDAAAVQVRAGAHAVGLGPSSHGLGCGCPSPLPPHLAHIAINLPPKHTTGELGCACPPCAWPLPLLPGHVHIQHVPCQ